MIDATWAKRRSTFISMPTKNFPLRIRYYREVEVLSSSSWFFWSWGDVMCLYQKLGGLSRMWQAHVSGSIIEEQPFFPVPEFAMCLSDSEDGYYRGILHLSEKSLLRYSGRNLCIFIMDCKQAKKVQYWTKWRILHQRVWRKCSVLYSVHFWQDTAFHSSLW